MTLNLYVHQVKAVEKLRSGSILCGGVGTGKSRTALAYFYTKVCGGMIPKRGKSQFSLMTSPKNLYIITTARKRDTFEWEKEMGHFLLTTRKGEGQVDVVVDSWNNIKKYVDVKDSFFIFDEQRLVGYGAWVKAFLKIAKSNEWILLSATPGDTWMDYMPVFIANGFYKNKTEFVREHVVYNRFSKFPKVERYVNVRKLERLRKSIVIPMDFKNETVRHHSWIKVGYDEILYKMASEDRWNPYFNEPIKNPSEWCHTLRKIVNSDIRRLKAAANVMSNHRRLIIFYNFDYELEMLRDLCKKLEVPYGEWNGHLHQSIPDEKRWAYLVQYTAGAEGWNCILTDAMLFFSLNYSYKILEQSCGRIDRMNTSYTDLYYYHLFSDSPIDKAIKKCIGKKKTFNEKTFFEGFSREKQGTL